VAPGLVDMETHDVTNLEADRLEGPDSSRQVMGWVWVADAPNALGVAAECTSATYPSQHDDKPPSGRLPGSGPRPSSTLGGLRVLVVEDDEDARELVVTVLEDAGAVVASADSAAAGFDAVRDFQPQLLVSDIGMPGEDGYSLMRRVRALGVVAGGDIPSIALTAYTRAEDRAKALRAGFSLHMAKPIRPSDLVTAIASLVEQPN
jgi:CheY-like chemotaxis protein